MSFQSELKSNMNALLRLKQCLTSEELSSFLTKMKKEWNPKTKEFNGELTHGSHKGDTFYYTMYWDNSKCIWTTKEFAFKAFVFSKISNAISLQFPKLFNEYEP